MKFDSDTNSRLIPWAQGIFTLAGAGGEAPLANFLQLPSSEEGAGILFGFSLTRFLLLVHCILLCGLLGLLGVSLWKPAWFDHSFEWLKTLFRNRPYLFSIITGLSFSPVITGVGLEIILNPTIFPRSILYKILYIRVRPLWLFFVWMAAGIMVFLGVSGWRRKIFPPQAGYSWKQWAGSGCVLLAGFFNIFIWFQITSPDAIWKGTCWILSSS